MEQPKYLSRGGDLNTRLNCPQILVPVSDGQVISNEDLDYEEIEDIDSDGSYHSEGDDIAEYWDPYCKYYCNNVVYIYHIIIINNNVYC